MSGFSGGTNKLKKMSSFVLVVSTISKQVISRHGWDAHVIEMYEYEKHASAKLPIFIV